MTVTIRFFASYAESLGMSSLALELEEGATIQNVFSAIALLPGASRLPPKPLVALNQAYAKPSEILRNGDEVALIPPVAGG